MKKFLKSIVNRIFNYEIIIITKADGERKYSLAFGDTLGVKTTTDTNPFLMIKLGFKKIILNFYSK